MPLSRVVESFDLATTRFDVVILDEASQCDVMGLLALALAREVVVVGDHEQVSPYAVGISADQVRGLIDELLPDVPNRQLYDGKTSVYDLAQQSFGGTIRLLEHFRCVPDIIRFSNELCYGGEIRPLREATSARVTPALVARRVEDGQEDRGINEREAQEIVALVAAMCRLEEYEDCSFGVISMIGTDQALYIDSLLRSRLSATEYRRRQILCGNASQFQGDERDVILLSMVNSPGKHPLAMRQRDDVRKVFNVAASRARDQLWVVHSLVPGRDLKGGDLRLRLISHAETGNAVAAPAERGADPGRAASPGKRMLCERLDAAGYQLLHRFAIGDGEIELVVEGQGGKRVAVECVGDRALPVDDVEEQLERQLGLRRLGWQFVRVRAADLVTDGERAFAALQRELAAAGVQPEAAARGKGRGRKKAPEPLHDKVVQRAAQIRARWQVPSSAELLARGGHGTDGADDDVPNGDDRPDDVDS
ncbi:MAG: AAA domain-containing protein [Planctomycetota bacterium]